MTLGRHSLDLIVIDQAGGDVDAVLHAPIDLAREADRGTVRQMPAVGEAHAQQRVARLHQRHEHRGVGLRARVRLHVGVIGAKQLARPLDGQPLGHVHVLAAAVVAAPRVALGVLVGQLRALRRQHARAGVVLGGDQLDVFFLAAHLVLHGLPQLGVEIGNGQGAAEHGLHSGRGVGRNAASRAGSTAGAGGLVYQAGPDRPGPPRAVCYHPPAPESALPTP